MSVDDHRGSTGPAEGTAAPVLRVGDVACRVISDGHVGYEPGFLFANVPAEDLGTGVTSRLDEDGLLHTPYRCLLVETPESRILVDTGLGELAAVAGAPAGRLLASLAEAGHSPDDIDMVVVTHAHPDHIGGLLRDGALTFPRARHVMSRIEHEFWTSEAVLSSLPELMAVPARALLPPLSDSGALDLADGQRELAPGVRLVPAPGHTPGHCVVTIGTGRDSAVFLADAILDEEQLVHPDWVGAGDYDEEATVRTRRSLLDDAAAGGHRVLAYHMPQAGRIERTADGYALVPDR